MVKDTAMVTMECTSVISNDLEWPWVA